MFSLAWLGLLCHKILPEGRTARQDLIFPIHHYSVLTGQWIPHTPPSRQFKALHLPLERRGRRVELGAHWQNLPSRCFRLNVLWSGRTFSASVLNFLGISVDISFGEITLVIFHTFTPKATGAQILQNAALLAACMKISWPQASHLQCLCSCILAHDCF